MKDKSYADKTAKSEESIPAYGETGQGKHPNSAKAIEKHQFKVGSSGNPSGAKPSYKKLKKLLNEIGDEQVTEYNSPDVCSDDYLLGNKGTSRNIGTRREVVLRKIWYDAQEGDDKKIQLLIYLDCLG